MCVVCIYVKEAEGEKEGVKEKTVSLLTTFMTPDVWRIFTCINQFPNSLDTNWLSYNLVQF